MQNERAFHFNEEIAICRQRIERSVGTPMPSPRPWRFCDADAPRGYSIVRSAAFPVGRAKVSETPRGPRPGALRPLWVCLVPIRAPAKAVVGGAVRMLTVAVFIVTMIGN